jgi:hypothetical protein
VQAACGAGPQRRLYVHIYDEPTRAAAESLRRALNTLEVAKAQRLSVPGVENVTAAAERAGRPPPIPWRQPTVLLHQGDDAACGRAVSDLVARLLTEAGHRTEAPPDVRVLPSRLTPQPATLELWLPPQRAAAR